MKFYLTIIIAIAVGVALFVGMRPTGEVEDDELITGPLPQVSMPPKPEAEILPAFVPSSQEMLASQTETRASATKTTAVAEICAGAEATNYDCYKAHYQKLVQTKSIAAAFVDLKARYDGNGFIKSQCHPITHTIGREAAKQFSTVGEAYKFGDGFCWSGYYHGVLETFIARIGIDNLPQQMDSVCAKVDGKERYSFDYYNCVHGLGHGLMSITDNELFDSLNYCDDLTGDWEQISCASGVYMENIIVEGLGRPTAYLKPSDPLYPCNASPEKYKNTCYLMQTSYILKVVNSDFSKTFEWCRKAETNYQTTCFQSLGRDASGRSVSDAEVTKATCSLGANFTERSNCIIGAVKDFISYHHSDVQALHFCSILDTELQKVCVDTGTAYFRAL